MNIDVYLNLSMFYYTHKIKKKPVVSIEYHKILHAIFENKLFYCNTYFIQTGFKNAITDVV